MPKWKARVTGTVHFDRTITVYAHDEDAAGVIAEEMVEDSGNALDTMLIEDVYIQPYTDENKNYEICMKVTDNAN